MANFVFFCFFTIGGIIESGYLDRKSSIDRYSMGSGQDQLFSDQLRKDQIELFFEDHKK